MSSLLSASIQEAFSLVAEPLERVKDSLLGLAPPESLPLADAVKHSLGSGGKYMRPVITLLSGQATQPTLNETQQHQLVEVAAVAEMIHVATLLHDDVIDGSELRRGKKTVRARWDNKISILGGDYLLAQASVKLSRLDHCRLVSIFAHVLADLCDGEVEQLHTSHTLNTCWDSYYKKTLGKTASLFSAGCESAGVINNLAEPAIQHLKAYGRHFGLAFQIVDDLLDYTATEAEMGKPVLDDLRNGLMNAPVLLALESEHLDATERQTLQTLIQALFEHPDQDETVERIRQLLTQARALEATQTLAKSHIRQAQEALKQVALDGPARRMLLNLADYVLERRH